MKILVKFQGMDQIVNAPDWIRQCGVFRTSCPHEPTHNVNVHFVGVWKNKVPVYFDERMLKAGEATSRSCP